jgi:hypothetical protein
MTNALYSARLVGKLAAASFAALLTACASTSPVLDANFGNAVRQARTAQTLNPVLGIDGQAGAAAQARYQDSFKAPPKTFEVIENTGN